MGARTLIVAFDGLDTDFIERYRLSFQDMAEYGRIDNHTGINQVVTSELFASFLTGTLADEHGVTGLRGWNSAVLQHIEQLLPKRGLFLSLGNKGKNIITCLGGGKKHVYTHTDLEHDTFLDTVPDSVTINVPAYDQNAFLDIYSFTIKHFGLESTAREAVKEFRQRQDEFWDAFADEPQLLMAHFHYLDSMNHLFGDEVEDEARLKAAYEEVDGFAQEILDAAEDNYDVIIFMSDHGLPTATAHNENAFYACNKELGLDAPHITDFRAVIEELAGTEAEAVDDLDV